MNGTTTVLTVVVGLLLGAVVALSGRLAGVTRELDDVSELSRVNAEVMEMRIRTRPESAEPGVRDQAPPPRQ